MGSLFELIIKKIATLAAGSNEYAMAVMPVDAAGNVPTSINPENAFVISGNSTADLTHECTLFIGVGGDVVVDMVGVGTAITFKNCPDGFAFPYKVKRVYTSTAGTTATNILGTY